MTLMRNRNLVRDLMHIGVVTCQPNTSIDEIARTMLKSEIDSLIVQDPIDGNSLGLISQTDLVKAYALEKTEIVTAIHLMKEEIPQILPEIPLITAAQMMLDNNIRTYYLMHHSGGIIYPAAYISYVILLRFLSAKEDQDLPGLGYKAERKTPLEVFEKKRDAARSNILNRREE